MSFEILKSVPTPEEIKESMPLSASLKAVKAERDEVIKNILMGNDDRFILIIGPCSANDPKAVLEYMVKLSKVQEKVKDKIFMIPRVYTNKPRTTGEGYKGMMHQPNPNEKPDIGAGIKAIRQMQIDVISESHLTAADEMLYPENLSYVDDLLSYHAVGARSVENQKHRLVSSGVEGPVGMKNPTSGDLGVMLNSIKAAQLSHTLVYNGVEVKSSGNPLAHGILRGGVNQYGRNIPNYHYEDLKFISRKYLERGLLNPSLVIDCNHANSIKQYIEQPRIALEIIQNMNYSTELRKMIKGLMIESYLIEGKQKELGSVYGQSITDGCLGWDQSEKLIYDIADKLK